MVGRAYFAFAQYGAAPRFSLRDVASHVSLLNTRVETFVVALICRYREGIHAWNASAAL